MSRAPLAPRCRKLWRPDEDISVKQLALDGVDIQVIADQLGRSWDAIIERLRKLDVPFRDIHMPRARNVNGRRPDLLIPTKTDDGAHVRDVLNAGGFGRIPLAWNQPRPFVWRAA